MSSQFGKYTLLRKLGDGGMAEVFLAQIQGLEGFTKLVALKRILPHLSQDETFTKSFINEARLGGYLNHHNIVQTLDFGQLGTFYYLAMEYVRGVTLADVLNAQKAVGRPMPPDMALQIALQIAEGLGYAHTAEDADGRPLRMVHRDLKPSNILINAHGVCKIADFGVARAESNVQKTVLAGEVKGTVYYMSPEQALGRRDLDGRSDLYSLGSILFEMLTNERLYPQESYLACLRMVQDGQIADQLPKVLGLEQGLHLYQLLSRVLAYDPRERHPDAFQLAKDIRHLLNHFDLEWELSDYLKRLLPDSPLVIRGTINSMQVGVASSGRHQLHATSTAPRTPSQRTPPPGAPSTRTPPPPTPASDAAPAVIPSLPGRRQSAQPPSHPGMASTPGKTLRSGARKKRRPLWRRREAWIVAAVFLIVIGTVGYRMATGGVTPVVVRSVPLGAKLTDNTGTVLGTAPARLRVPRSGMDISASLEGYETVSTHLSGSKHQRDVLLHLDPIKGKVEIAVAPPSAKVSLDDEPLEGKPPYRVADLPVGSHVVSATSPGYAPAVRSFDVVSSSPVSISLELKQEKKTLSAESAGNNQNQKIARSSQETAKHEVASTTDTNRTEPASKESTAEEKKEARVETQAEQPTRVTRPPRPPATTPAPSVGKKVQPAATAQTPGYLTLNAFPYAFVEIDGVRVKNTPLFHHELPPGPHKISLKTEDGRVKTLDIVIESGATLKKIVKFDKAQ